MIVIQFNTKWRLLMEAKFLAGFVPKLTAVCKHFRSNNTIEDYHAIGSEDGKDFLHDFLEVAAVTADENGVGQTHPQPLP